MKRRTKNIIEDILVIVGILVVLYLIYFFVFKNSDEQSLENIKKEPKVEIVTKDSELDVGFLSKLYEEIKEKFFENKEQNEIDSKTYSKIEEKKEESIKNIHLSQRAEILSKQEERERELSSKEQTSNIENSTNSETIKQEEVKNSTTLSEANEKVEEKSEAKVEEKTEDKSEAKVEEKSVIEQKKDEHIEQTTSEIKVLEDVKTDENSDEANHDVANIDDFFDRFDKKIYSNIDRSFDKTSFKRGEFVNIRVTILKDGRYEQLTFLNGNSEYFNKIRPQIEQVFPLNIEEALKSHFPRYYRMKIDF